MMSQENGNTPENPAPAGRCPVCGKSRVAEYRPFCSKRCADIDLGRWLKGNYVIAGSAETDEDGNAGRPLADEGGN